MSKWPTELRNGFFFFLNDAVVRKFAIATAIEMEPMLILSYSTIQNLTFIFIQSLLIHIHFK